MICNYWRRASKHNLELFKILWTFFTTEEIFDLTYFNTVLPASHQKAFIMELFLRDYSIDVPSLVRRSSNLLSLDLLRPSGPGCDSNVYFKRENIMILLLFVNLIYLRGYICLDWLIKLLTLGFKSRELGENWTFKFCYRFSPLTNDKARIRKSLTPL